MISYHVLGRIPTITFVKDKSKGDLARLNQLFEIADYGPDYFPSTGRDKDKSHIIMWEDSSVSSSAYGHASEKYLDQNLFALGLEQPLDIQKVEKCLGDNLENLSSEAGWKSECELSPAEVSLGGTSEELISGFRSNLYGLPRDDLMKKIMTKKKKVKYQTSISNTADLGDTSHLDLQLSDYRKLRGRAIKDKEKMLQQRDSTKVKQRLLEQEFDGVQDSLYRDFTDDDAKSGGNQSY